jgi:hypothetical protein
MTPFDQQDQFLSLFKVTSQNFPSNQKKDEE